MYIMYLCILFQCLFIMYQYAFFLQWRNLTFWVYLFINKFYIILYFFFFHLIFNMHIHLILPRFFI